MTLLVYYFYLLKYVDPKNILNSSGKDIVYLSYMFIFICFQYILVIFVFNYKSIHRKHFTTNSIFIIGFLLILNIILQFLYFTGTKRLNWVRNFIEFEDNNEIFEYFLELNKLNTQILIAFYLILAMIIEILIVIKL